MKIKTTFFVLLFYILTNNIFGMDIKEMHVLVQQQETPTKTVVPMWGAKYRFNPTLEPSYTMETSGLNGCIATAVVITYKNGSSASIIRLR